MESTLLFGILKLIGALGFFIYGMKVMSEGIQQAAGDGLRRILATMTQNRFLGVLSGLLITMLIQSSSATTVMTVSFVNAGLMSLVESAGVMMGANIGTTFTGWLVATIGFKIKIGTFALPMFAFGTPMLLIGKNKVKYWGEFILGFALLFMGLDFIKSSVPDLQQNSEVLAFVQDFTELGYFSYIVFILIGTILTIIVQSSSAAMTITFVLVAKGWIPFEYACSMVLGENIGTTITAELASMVGNVYAKRSARIHSMFNLIGVGWMIILLIPFFHAVDWVTVHIFNEISPLGISSISTGSPEESSVTMGLAIFHTMFNVTNVVIMIWFVPALIRVVNNTVVAKNEEDKEYRLEFIGDSSTLAPDIAFLEAKKEIVGFGELDKKMNDLNKALKLEKDASEAFSIIESIKNIEEHTDNLEVDISDYLLKVSEGNLSDRQSIEFRSMLSIINDLERIADLEFQFAQNIKRKLKEKTWFTPEQRTNIISMVDLVGLALDNMNGNLRQFNEDVSLEEAHHIENQINHKRNLLRKQHLSSIENKDYNIKSGLIYNNLYILLERIGDHVMNVNEAITEIYR